MDRLPKYDGDSLFEILKHKGQIVLDSEQYTPVPLHKIVSLTNLLELAKSFMTWIQEAYNESTNKCYANPDVQKSSELLYEVLRTISYYDSSPEKSEIINKFEQYEKEYKIIEIFSDVSTELLKIGDNTEFPGIQDEHIKSLNTLLSYLVHTSEDDRELCNKIAQLTEFLKAETKRLDLWREPYFSKRSKQMTEGEDIPELLCRLLYIVTMFEENIQRIRDVKCIETMTPYLNSANNGIRLLSLAVLSNIANETEIQTLKINAGIIKFLVWAVSVAIKTECKVWDIWSLTELAKRSTLMTTADDGKSVVTRAVRVSKEYAGKGIAGIMLKWMNIGEPLYRPEVIWHRIAGNRTHSPLLQLIDKGTYNKTSEQVSLSR
ncbi:unnamed protein product [Mytilus coruscus]|uniref:Uncharacterized protein n=1 Tax=Mytilus coruscus TaxID=42192 RepID=A0A6J8EQ06_MYTCO|nr:unnamed protein product [Mytilus coruscus]